MNINRDNYETIFLLYIDNELSAAERKAVEEFVALHTDLREELMQLQDAVLEPGDLAVFADKNSLLKSSLVDDAMEENMLMLLDNELDPSEAKVVEKMIASNPKLQEDWEILQRTKQDPNDTIVFEEKHLLYRKERDNVIAGRFVRWAVAAMLIGAGFFTTITFINRKQTEKPDVAVKVQENKGNQLANIQVKNQPEQDSNNTGVATTIAPGIDTKGIRYTATDNAGPKEKQPQQQLATKEKNIPEEKVLPEIKSIVPEETKLLASNTTARQVEKISPEKTDVEMAISALQKKPDLRDINMLDQQKNSIASTASLTEETNDNRILYMNEDDVARSKAGGFFRKLKRTITRKANLKTGNGLKIAGFEIALK